jgi:hypothetical protein
MQFLGEEHICEPKVALLLYRRDTKDTGNPNRALRVNYLYIICTAEEVCDTQRLQNTKE